MFQNRFWFLPGNVLGIEALYPPAEETVVRAHVDNRRHLQTAVGFDTVKFLFITRTVMKQTLLDPVA